MREWRYVGVPESRRLKATPVIGANAAFNNRTKEELEMHMFEKNVEFPPKNLLTLSLSVALVIFTLTVGLAKDNTEQKREAPGWVWVRDGGGGEGVL